MTKITSSILSSVAFTVVLISGGSLLAPIFAVVAYSVSRAI